MPGLRKYILAVGIVLYSYGIASAQVSFGIKGGAVLQTFSEESESEIWPNFGVIIDYKLPDSPFGFRGDIGGGFHQKEEEIKTTKADIQLGLGVEYLYKIASSAGVYGGEIPSCVGIYVGVGPGIHYYWVQEEYADSLVDNSEMGVGLHLFGGGEYLISGYALFCEIGGGKIFRGDVFQEERLWTQLMVILGIRF